MNKGGEPRSGSFSFTFTLVNPRTGLNETFGPYSASEYDRAKARIQQEFDDYEYERTHPQMGSKYRPAGGGGKNWGKKNLKKNPKRVSSWIKHWMDYRKKHGCSVKEAMKKAKSTYK